MSEQNQSSHSAGIGFFGLLTIVFITLKLCHVIEWSWWWVLSPMLFAWGLCVAILLFVFGVFLLSVIFKK